MGGGAVTFGQVAFEAQRDYLGGNRPWSELRKPERQVWEATAAAVVAAVIPPPVTEEGAAQ